MGRPKQSDVRSKGGESDLRLLRGDLRAYLPDNSAGSIHKQRTALHDATAESDPVRSEKSDKIGQSKSEVIAFAFHALQSKRIATLRGLANSRGGAELCEWVLFANPCNHGRSAGEAFPASASAAIALGSGVIEYLMTYLGMRAIHAPVEVAAEKKAAANPGADGDVEEASAGCICSPTRFGESRRIGVVLNRDSEAESCLKFSCQAATLPAGQSANLTNDACERVKWPWTSYADSGKLRSAGGQVAQHCYDVPHGVREAFFRFSGTLESAKNLAVFPNGSDGDLGSANIDRSYRDHSDFHPGG